MTLNQYASVVHGALREYDLPNLALALGTTLTVEQAMDAMGKPLPTN